MAYSWFRVDSSIGNHPKTGDLEVALGDPNALAYVIRLFCWAQQYATSGRIKYSRADQIESAMHWKGERGKLIEALLQVGWLDDDSEGHFVAHDWDEKQAALIEKSERDAKRLKKTRTPRRAGDARPTRDESATDARAPRVRTDGEDERTYGRTNERTEKEEAPPPADQGKVVPLPKQPDDPFATAEGFWASTQEHRLEVGLPVEKPPHPSKLSAWWSEALGELTGEAKPLAAAYLRFLKDPYWRKASPPCPFQGFMSQWRNFLVQNQRSRHAGA